MSGTWSRDQISYVTGGLPWALCFREPHLALLSFSTEARAERSSPNATTPGTQTLDFPVKTLQPPSGSAWTSYLPPVVLSCCRGAGPKFKERLGAPLSAGVWTEFSHVDAGVHMCVQKVLHVVGQC